MILEKIKNIFFRNNNDKSGLTVGFNEVYSFIKVYEKAGDYSKAILAIRELILKHKSATNYFEQLLKKLYTLEASNIKAISIKAKNKIKKVEKNLDVLYNRINILDKKLIEIEFAKKKHEEANKNEIEKKIIKKQIKEINEYISKKDYVKALTQAKKFVFDFQSNKDAINILTKAQKYYDNSKKEKSNDTEDKNKLYKTLFDLGIKKQESDNISKKAPSFLSNFKNFILNLKKINEGKREYINRMKTLNQIEKLLLISGNIETVSQININQEEMFLVVNNGLTKDIEDFKIYGFDTFGKIMGKDKIIGDTFGYYKTNNNKSIFYFGDATGHGIKAGFTVAVLSKLFFEFTKEIKTLQELFLNLNNSLKEKIKGREFITGIFFEWDYVKNILKIVGAGHLPLLVYRRKLGIIERIIPGGLALGVRLINNVSSIKTKEIQFDNNDVLIGYTDGIIENKDITGNMFGIDRLEKSILKNAKNFFSAEKIYEHIMEDINDFRGNVQFLDDVSMFVFNRDFNKDILTNKQELEEILKENNSKKTLKDINIKKRTKEEIIEELKKEKYERELKIRLQRLDRFYKIGEYIKLKQEILMYYKEGFVHDKMRIYLEKALANERFIVARKLEEKLHRKYTTLLDLYKKGEYELVIKESLDVIFKNGKI